MVFYYSIRGGQCLNGHSHLHLSPSDIVCYVGRDKHENEYLIKYGWPGDIWFHVDGLSSAHVYFRLKNVETVSSIPIDDLPPDSVYDMMQICKNNSIAGCKLASCKMVYTPHSNLKKTFEMESGAVTYHNTKFCRYQRCDKDRTRVKELEKTKSADIQIDYYEEMKQNERRIIERKKRAHKAKVEAATQDIYDPIEDDITATARRATRQGDEQSGLDAALEGLSFVPMSLKVASTDDDHHHQQQNYDHRNDTREVASQDLGLDQSPQWRKEEHNRRQNEPSDDVRFLRERGYTATKAFEAWEATQSRLGALHKLYNESTLGTSSSSSSSSGIPEMITEARREEKEVLLAIFGEDDDATFQDADNEDSLDVSLPVTAYEPPKRYENPPPLLLEVYVDNNIAPLYPNKPPVLALVGGGLPEAKLRQLTDVLRTEASKRIEEERGEPQIFNLITFLGDEAERIVHEEAAEIELERKARLEEKRAAKAAEAAKRKKDGFDKHTKTCTGFMNDGERRAYAIEVVNAGKNVKIEDVASNVTNTKSGKHYDTGVSDQSLINDLFG